MALKKVLIITYYWPPAGGPGVQRVLKFAKYLPEFGWQPIVLTVKNGEYPALDPGLIEDIPSECKVYATPTIEFFQLFKRLSGRKKEEKIETYILNRDKVSLKDRIFSWIRQNFFVPDARVGWYWYAVREGKQIIKAEQPDVIFSSSPPHSLQLIARKLAGHSGLPWVADFRDPWTEAFWDKSLGRTLLARRRNEGYEKKVLTRASAVTTVSKGVRDIYLRKKEREGYYVLPNGYDGSEFQLEKQTNSQFRLVYAGHIAQSQNPDRLFAAIAGLEKRVLDQLQIDFFGSVDQAVLQSIHRYGLTDQLQLHGYVAHSRVLQEIVQADLLLLLIPKEHGKGILTGKVFEYLATQNYILGIGDPEGEAAELLEAYGAGRMYDYSTDFLPVLKALFRDWKAGQLPKPNPDVVAQYDRRELTLELTKIFESLCS